MSGAEEAGEYDAMDFSETDRLFAERAAEPAGGAKWIVDIGAGNAKIPLAPIPVCPSKPCPALRRIPLTAAMERRLPQVRSRR
jgi:hypothetical protein